MGMQNDTEELEGAMGSLLASYDHLMVNLRDPRSDSWPLMSSIWPTTFICIAYVYIVKARAKFYEEQGALQHQGHHDCLQLISDPVLCLDVLCELDLFWILPWKSQVQLAL